MASELRNAFYDFSVSPFSYDFLAFICQSRSLGCNHTIFVPGTRSYQKCSPEEQKFRLEHLLVPLARMSGDVTVCESREEAESFGPAIFPHSYTVKKPTHGHMFGQLIRSGRAKWLTPSTSAMNTVGSYLMGRTPITMTIRESRIKPLRNSKIGEWVKAAEMLKDEGQDVLFVPDTDNLQMDFGGFDSYQPAALNPDIRLALYSQAKLNLGIGNGPMGLCFYSKLPYLMFRFQDEAFQEQSASFLKANNLPPGSQAPWSGNHQRIVWEDDKAEIIFRQVQLWELRKAA